MGAGTHNFEVRFTGSSSNVKAITTDAAIELYEGDVLFRQNNAGAYTIVIREFNQP